MLRIDSVELLLKEGLEELNYYLTQKKIPIDSVDIESAPLIRLLGILQYILRELDTCISVECQRRDNKEF